MLVGFTIGKVWVFVVMATSGFMMLRVFMLKILGSEVPRSTAVLCTDSLVARPRGTEIRREVCSYAFLIV